MVLTKTGHETIHMFLNHFFPPDNINPIARDANHYGLALRLVRLAGFSIDEVWDWASYSDWKCLMDLKNNGPEPDVYCASARCLCVNMSDKRESIRATYWLEKIVHRLKDTPTDLRVAALEREVVASIPLCPIVVTPECDTLHEIRTGYGIVRHVRGGDTIDPYAVRHGACTSKGLKLIQTSSTHWALICQDCCLRVSFPNKVTTYADLRAHFYHLQRLRWTR